MNSLDKTQREVMKKNMESHLNVKAMHTYNEQ
jgi:hypothetical protein